SCLSDWSSACALPILTQDVQTVAAWGADYLKMDWCYVGRQSARRTYAHISRTAAATGHPMVFSVSNWGHNAPWDWGPQVANLWQIGRASCRERVCVGG